MGKNIQSVVLRLILLTGVVQAVDEECLVRSRLSGDEVGTYMDDMDQLKEIFKSDMRLWGI